LTAFSIMIAVTSTSALVSVRMIARDTINV
jgi:hypothetical protein